MCTGKGCFCLDYESAAWTTPLASGIRGLLLAPHTVFVALSGARIGLYSRMLNLSSYISVIFAIGGAKVEPHVPSTGYA